MSHDRGNRAAAWVAEYLRPWWPSAEKTPNGRPGVDILGTPGVEFEIKTGAVWRTEWVTQVLRYVRPDQLSVPVLVYLPPGMGAKSVHNAQAIMPLHVLMQVLEEAGYAPQPRKEAS